MTTSLYFYYSKACYRTRYLTYLYRPLKLYATMWLPDGSESKINMQFLASIQLMVTTEHDPSNKATSVPVHQLHLDSHFVRSIASVDEAIAVGLEVVSRSTQSDVLRDSREVCNWTHARAVARLMVRRCLPWLGDTPTTGMVEDVIVMSISGRGTIR